MLDLRQQHKEFRKSRPLHALFNGQCFIDDTTLLTKSGDVVVFIEYHGPDPECIEPHRIDALNGQIRAALKAAFGPGFVLSTYFLKSSDPPIDSPAFGSAVLDEAAKSRHEFLIKKGVFLYKFETYLVVLLKPKWKSPRLSERLVHLARSPRKALRQSLRMKGQAAFLDEVLAEAIKELHNAVRSFIQQTNGVLSARVLHKKEAFALMRRFFNPCREKAEAIYLTSDLHVDYFTVDSVLEVHSGYLRLDDYYVKSFTLKRPPAHTFANILGDLHAVQVDMALVTEWTVWDTERAIAHIRANRRHHHNLKVSLWSQVGSEKPSERELLFDDSKEALVRDLGACLQDIEMNGVQIGEFSLTVILTGKTLEQVERAGADVMRVFGAHEAALNEERYNGLNAFLAAMPGGYPFNVRRLLVTNGNQADMCPWFLPAEGDKTNKFLRAPYLIAFETEDRSLFYYSPHVGDVAHTGILGPTGTGKSFLMSCLITHVQAYAPYTVIFGLGGDYGSLTEHLGGAYLKCRPEKQPFPMNPYQLEPTPANLQFEFAFTKLIAERGDFRMSDSQARETFEAIRYLPVLPPELRRLSTLATTVGKAVGDHLKPWTEGEQYGAWFDNPQDCVAFQRYTYIDFEGMERLGVVLEAILFYLLYRTNDIVYDESLLTTFKTLWLDEAWRFFRHPVTRAYIVEALRTWRKKNGGVFLATQSLEDLEGSDVLRPVVENCPTQILLANPKLDAKVYEDVLGLNAIERDRIKALQPKRQFLLKREGLSKVLNLNVDPKSYWLFTTNPFEAKRRDEAISRHGLHAALEILKEESPQ